MKISPAAARIENRLKYETFGRVDLTLKPSNRTKTMLMAKISGEPAKH
jgi:hypothetical protein